MLVTIDSLYFSNSLVHMIFILVSVFFFRSLRRCRNDNACYIHSRAALTIGIIVKPDTLYLTTLALVATWVSVVMVLGDR